MNEIRDIERMMTVTAMHMDGVLRQAFMVVATLSAPVVAKGIEAAGTAYKAGLRKSGITDGSLHSS